MKKNWWKESVVYQIYPRSFYDSNGDGIGDLRGIIQKLDYLKQLGVDVVWLSPVYRSPNDDNGYDISDYRNIMDEFGSLSDWEEMLDGMHARGIKLLMDLVVNHTSDEHPWFRESRKSKENPYRDYYIWRSGKDGREPNNWASIFQGSAWELDPATGEYYLHLFSRKQPDLNWENPQVRAQVYDMMKWWLNKGIDGFRMDVINLISKAPGLPDAPVASPTDRYHFGGKYFINGPRLMEYLNEMKQEVLSHYDIFTVGEAPFMSPEQALALVGEEQGYLNMIFQFDHVDLDTGADRSSPVVWEIKPWKLSDLKRVITRWQKGLEGKAWNSLYLSNHDLPRAVSHFGDDGEYRVQSAKLLATFLHMLQGTPYIYQGEEIGMTNVLFESIEEYRDIDSLNLYQEAVQRKGIDPEIVMNYLHAKSRDNARTPVQWDDSPQAGFTMGRPWIKVNRNYSRINIKQSLNDPDSIFYYYQKLIGLRKINPIMIYGRYHPLLDSHEQIYAFTRTWENDRLLVILNFGSDGPVFELPGEIRYGEKELLISNYEVDPTQDISHLSLRPYEARVYRLT